MVLDSVHLMYEAGYDVLPNNLNPLKQGWVRPPNAMDGIPAPLSITVNPEDSKISKVKRYVFNTLYFKCNFKIHQQNLCRIKKACLRGLEYQCH